jgi:hypothetical protein
MDNLGSHKGIAVRAALRAIGAKLCEVQSAPPALAW